MFFGAKKPLFVVGLFVVALVLPLTVLILQQQQETRGRAQAVCAKVPADISVVIDRSPSMNDRFPAGSSTTKMAGARLAARDFVNLLAQDPLNRVDLVTYHGNSRLDVPLTSNFSSVTSAVDAISTNGTSGTCIQCGVLTANADISSSGRSGFKKVVVLLTDGRANFISPNNWVSGATAEAAALAAVRAGKAASGTIFFTIGLGTDVNTTLLQQIATETGGRYYFPPSTESLNAIYAEISQVISQGSVSGIIFNDVNQNGVLDQGEQKLPGRGVQAVSTTSSASGTLSATSDANGNYFIPGLCNGSYDVKLVPQPGWTQTLPANSQNYPITVINGNAFIGKDFGVATAPIPTVVPSASPTLAPSATTVPTATNAPTPFPSAIIPPTATPTPLPLRFSLDLLLHGIGSSGDNANPTANSLSNKSPKHPTQNATVSIFDVNNNAIGTGSGNIVYTNGSGSYRGLVTVDAPISSGAYSIKVRTPQHLFKLIPGIQRITGGDTHVVPSVHLVAGDINNDNKLNILDYNLLLNCYSDLAPAVACN